MSQGRDPKMQAWTSESDSRKMERPMSPTPEPTRSRTPLGGRSLVSPFDRSRLGSAIGDRCTSPVPTTCIRPQTPVDGRERVLPRSHRDRSCSPGPGVLQQGPTVDRSKSPLTFNGSSKSVTYDRTRSPVNFPYRSQSPHGSYERSASPSGRRSVSPVYHGRNDRVDTGLDYRRARSPAALKRRTELPPGVTVVTVRPRSTPPDIRLNIETDTITSPAPPSRLLTRNRPSRLQSNNPRTRYSVGDLHTLLRNGYAADPVQGGLYKAWSGSRRTLSASLQDGLDSAGESDSGLGDDLWCQYRSILQQKKKRILEEHTSWVNEMLKRSRCQPVDDLVQSVADGQTLANLLRILTDEKVTVAHGNPIQYSQRAENLQHCLEHLGVNGVDTQGINGRQLADGNLKSTLVLMNNLRKKYDSPQSYPTRSSSGERDAPGVGPQSRPPSGYNRYPTDRGATPATGNPARATTPVQRQLAPEYNAARRTPELRPPADLLPGSINSDRPPPRPQLPQGMTNMSLTELHKDSVIQHGINGEHRSHSTVEFSQANSRRDYPPLGPPTSPPQPPTQATQAWQSGNNLTSTKRLNTATGPSVDHHPHSQPQQPQGQYPPKPGSMPAKNGIVNTGYVYDDGELLVPPKPRENPARDIRDQNRHSYVPSHPNDRPPEGARATNLTTSHLQSAPQKGAPYNRNPAAQPPPNYLPPPQYNRPGPSQPHPQGPASQSPSVRSREDLGNSRGNLGMAPFQSQSSSHPPQTTDNHCHSSTPAQRGNNHSYNNYTRPSQPQSLPTSSRPQPLHISHGRTSPQGQSSTPASQSPNHDKSSPPYGSQGQTRLLKDSQQHPPSSQELQKQNVQQHQSHVNQKLVDSGKKGQIGPSSAYPPTNMVPKDSMGQGYTKAISSPQVRRVASPAIDSKHVHYQDYHKQQKSETPTNHQPTSLKADQLYGPSATDGLHSSKMAASPAQAEKSRWNNTRNTPETKYHTTQQHMEMQRLPKGRPPSHGQHIPDSQWDKPGPSRVPWKDQPPTKASAEWEDSDDSSITPPLPPLSPSNTPPGTPPLSPIKGHHADLGASRYSSGYGSKTPTGKGGGQKRRGRRSGSSVIRMDGGWKKSGAPRAAHRSPGRAITVRNRHNDDLDSGDNGSTTNMSGGEEWDDVANITEVRQMRQQMDGLETMYTEILKMVGLDREYLPGSRGSISSVSTASRATAGRRTRANSHRTTRELKQVNKRFARLESHVVTLARSVAHLSSEMRAQNALYQELEDLKKDVRHLKKERQHSQHLIPGGTSADLTLGAGGKPSTDWDRFRGWIPSITNPKRVKKLAKFFGQDRLLHYFLEKLGYTKYIKNFEAEEITILELPYMNEDRLEKLGIPMGPRQRILQEAQLCFRQENFSIYIV